MSRWSISTSDAARDVDLASGSLRGSLGRAAGDRAGEVDEGLARQGEPADPLEVGRQSGIVHWDDLRRGFEPADDLARLVEVAVERALRFARARPVKLEGAGGERDVVEAQRGLRTAVLMMPETGSGIEAVERKELPAFVGDQMDRVEDVGEGCFAHGVGEVEADERNLRAGMPEGGFGVHAS